MHIHMTRLFGSTAAVALIALHPAAFAQSPQSPTVAAGSIAVSRQGATTVVTQATTRGIIDWRSFSIGPQNAVRFDQPGTSSVTLNRVTGTEASRIDGSLSANGQVWLANPNGVVIGAGGQVNVGGLMATTGRVNAPEFQNSGRAQIDQIAKDASIVNAGSINIAEGGYAALAAAAVRNDGVIAAKSGSVALGSGKAMTLDFTGDKLIQYQVTQPLDQAPAGAAALVENAGVIRAAGGAVLLTARAAKGVMDNVVNMKGVIVSNAVRVDGGTVVFGDGGAVNVSGRIDAGDASGAGGSVAVLGEKVGLLDGARVDASGATGGGTVLIGGDWQGGGKGQNAQVAYVSPTASINADATVNGAGGKVVIWADDSTRYSGAISARGGAQGGDGGRVETSGKRALSVGPIASVTTSGRAAGSRAGAWLLDPSDVNIQIGGLGGLTGGVYDPLAATGQIDPSTINIGLLSNNVTIQTSSGTGGAGNITFNSGTISYNSAVVRSLTLAADRDIFFSPGAVIKLSGGAHNVTLNSAAGAGTQGAVAGRIGLNGGTITTTGGAISLVGGSGGGLNAQSAVAGSNAGISVFGNSVIDAGAGSITMRGQGLATDATAFVNGVSIGTSTINANGGITMVGVGGAASTSTGFGIVLISTLINATGGTINLTGTGAGAANTGGVSISQSTISYSGGNLNITATAGGGGTTNTGLFIGTTTITGGSAVNFSGTGGAGTSGSNAGVSINQSTLSLGGGATLNGTGGGGVGSSADNGVFVNGSTLQAAGGIALTGTRGAGENSNNIQIFGSSILSATGGSILMTANAATGGGVSFSNGVALQNSVLKTDAGSVVINGLGSTSGAQSDGVSIGGSTSLISVTGGNITVTGFRGGGAQSNNVNVFGAATISNAGGNIVISGALTSGGAVSFNNGVNLGAASLISTSTGTITVSGSGASAGTLNTGVNLNGTISATGATGAILLQSLAGTGQSIDVNVNAGSRIAYADATNTNAFKIVAGRDVNIASGASLSFAGANDIVLNAGANSTSQALVGGVINVKGNLTTTGGTITMGGGVSASLAAQQGSNLTSHAGVSVNSAIIDAGAGAIIIRGNGGSVDTNSIVNGVSLFASTLTSGGGITLIGTGGSAATGDGVASPAGAGVNVNNTGLTATGAGAISITGTSSAVAADQRGVTIQSGASIALGTGTLSITGNGGATTYGRGVFFTTATVIGAGPMVITGVAGQGSNPNPNSSSPHGVYVFNSTITETGGANITIVGTRGLSSAALTARNISIDTSTISTVSGNLSLIGTSTFGGSSVSASHGVDLRNGALLTTATGTISLSGAGALTGIQNYGIRLGGGVPSTTSTITATGANGAIVLNGVAGADPNARYGIYSDGTDLSAANGSIRMNSDFGVRQSGAVITPSLLLTGSGADYALTSARNSVGVLAADVGSLNFVESSSASLTIGSISGVSGVAAAAGVTLTGSQSLTLDLPVTASNVTLATNGTISGAGAVVASTAPVYLAALGGGAVEVVVNGNTGAAAAPFVTMMAGSLSVNGVSLVYTPPSVAPVVTTPTVATVASVATVATVATVASVATVATVATIATVASVPTAATVASTATAASQPTQSAVAKVLEEIVGSKESTAKVFAQILTPVVKFDLVAPTIPTPTTAVTGDASAGSSSTSSFGSGSSASSDTKESDKQGASTESKGGATSGSGASGSSASASAPRPGSAQAIVNAVTNTVSGALIPPTPPSVGGTGAPLISTRTIKVDAADTGGSNGQVVASSGASGGGATTSVVPGLVSKSNAPAGQKGAKPAEPPLAQQPSHMNEESFLD